MTRLAAMLTAAAMFGFLMGCSEPRPAPTNSSPATSPGSGGESDHKGHENHEAHQHREQSTDVEAALASLPTEDRELAEKQGKCPVTDEPLGSMGTPLKVDVNGKSVFICCEGCREELLADSEKFLKELE